MTNDTPTLAQFAEALARVKAKHPGAPGLPEGHYFRREPGDTETFIEYVGGTHRQDHYLSLPAALALCVVTVMKNAVHYRCQTGNKCGFRHAPGFTGRYEWFCDDKEGEVDDLEAAALAMLEVIGGQ